MSGSTPIAPAAVRKAVAEPAEPSTGGIDVVAGVTPRADVTPEVREQILASLYESRRAITRRARMGQAGPGDASELAELESYINKWEAEMDHSRAEVWTRLDELAQRLVDLGTRQR